jgi:integral membrane protein (TIGR00529 family)
VFPSWLSFFIIIALILIFSKKELGIILAIAALIFGFLTQVNVISSLITVFTNPSIIFLAISVALIPILGGIMEESKLILELIEKLKISKKFALILSPALFGLLPIPGGALMSAPIVDQIDVNLKSERKVGINVWYRHSLLLIYPISSAILVSSALSGIPLYSIVLILVFPFILMNLTGYLTLLRSVERGGISNNRDLKKVLHNLFPIMIAPIIDFLGRTFLKFVIPEIFLLLGICISIIIALEFTKFSFVNIKEIIKKMKIWRFPLLIIAMFLFLEVFIKSGVPEEIGSLKLPLYLFIFISFFLGFATGRVQLPISILIPIYLFQNALLVMPLLDFTFIYFAVYLGYIMTPLHPCLAYNISFFKTNYKNSFKYLAFPTFICLGVLYLVYFILLLLI